MTIVSKLARLPGTSDDFVAGVDLFEAALDRAEADELVVGQFAEDGDIAGDRDAELHHVLIDSDLLHRLDNRRVAPFGAPAATAPVAAAQVQSGLHAIDAVEHFVDFGGGEIHFVLRVGEGVAVRGIDQHAEVGFVDLHHGDAGLLQFEQLSAEDGHQCVDEFVTGGIGPGRDFFFPQAHSQ